VIILGPTAHTTIDEKSTTFAKAYGIKVRCYGEHVEEHIGNLMGTNSKFKVNIVGTHCERGKNEKQSFPLPPKLQRKKKQGTLSACLGLPIGCMKFLFPKEFVTIFGLG
jgi:hypothetical protein